MVVPMEIMQAARDGDVAAVRAWLNAGGDVNDRDDIDHDTVLLVCVGTPGARTEDMIIGVRAAGSWKQYCRRDHKQILRLRSLITRGRARERLAATPAIKFMLRQGDNGIVWTILSFWQATN